MIPSIWSNYTNCNLLHFEDFFFQNFCINYLIMIESILMFDQICTKSISAFSHVQGIFLWARQSGGVLLSPSHLRWYVHSRDPKKYTHHDTFVAPGRWTVTSLSQSWPRPESWLGVESHYILGQTWESSEYTMNLKWLWHFDKIRENIN